jgi:hypothetical protein
VAYFAHIGGFLTGMVLIPFFKRRDVKLFADGRVSPSAKWSPEPVSFSTLKQEARARYKRQRGGSVPAVQKRTKGPWG